VVLTIKYLFILIMVHFLSLCETKYERLCTLLVEVVGDVKYCVCKTHTALLEFIFPNVTFPSTLQLFLIFFGAGLEVLTVVRIPNGDCVRTSYSVVHVYECFGEAF
jgi:hypothetical protein